MDSRYLDHRDEDHVLSEVGPPYHVSVFVTPDGHGQVRFQSMTRGAPCTFYDDAVGVVDGRAVLVLDELDRYPEVTSLGSHVLAAGADRYYRNPNPGGESLLYRYYLYTVGLYVWNGSSYQPLDVVQRVIQTSAGLE